MHHVMTLAERERLAYMAGDVELAKALARAQDAEDECGDCKAQINELENRLWHTPSSHPAAQ